MTNTNTASMNLTYTTLEWTDYYDPNMDVDFLALNGEPYWGNNPPLNDFESPTTTDSNLPVQGLTTAIWEADFDGYGNLYGKTHTIGPFTVTLTFNSECVISATIPLVEADVLIPSDGQVISDRSQTNFEAVSWDTGVGTNNGDGINQMHLVILDPSGTVRINLFDTSAPYCFWGIVDPCPLMSEMYWNSFPNGDYTLIAWGRSSVTNAWSSPVVLQFRLARFLPTETPWTTETALPSDTPTPTPSSTPIP